MAELKHTPGPWVVALRPEIDGELMPDGSGGYSHTGRMVYDPELGVCTKEDLEQGEYEPEPIARPWSEADAHLIAAAPDLLAALKVAVCHVRDRDPDKPMMLSAIARAEGKGVAP